MKILHAEICNFGSYTHFEFDFRNRGLTLISGPTGSGKSTLCDIIPWVWFGKTAKGGAVDEIRNWSNEGQTIGIVRSEKLTVFRKRGKLPKDNDLSFWPLHGVETRGKDIPDTQRLINEQLGFNFDLYLSSAYFHEFSETAQFFTTTAKNRREITEQLADLKLAKTLATQTSEYKKEVKEEINRLYVELGTTGVVLTVAKKEWGRNILTSESWEKGNAQRILELEKSSKSYEETYRRNQQSLLEIHFLREQDLKAEILELEQNSMAETEILDRNSQDWAKLAETYDECPTCGRSGLTEETFRKRGKAASIELGKDTLEKINARLVMLDERLSKQKNQTEACKNAEVPENPYKSQLLELRSATNPYKDILDRNRHSISELEKIVAVLQKDYKDFQIELNDLEVLSDVTDTFRGVLVNSVIETLQTKTNDIFNTYFDSEIQVEFKLSDADKLEVSITKDGNKAAYHQLSKGQRQLLKLSFAISVMQAVQNHHGLDFDAIFLDEALDGLDDILKVKAFDLLQALSLDHSSVFCIDHNETLKSMFPNRYDVEMTEQGSRIEQT